MRKVYESAVFHEGRNQSEIPSSFFCTAQQNSNKGHEFEAIKKCRLLKHRLIPRPRGVWLWTDNFGGRKHALTYARAGSVHTHTHTHPHTHIVLMGIVQIQLHTHTTAEFPLLKPQGVGDVFTQPSSLSSTVFLSLKSCSPERSKLGREIHVSHRALQSCLKRSHGSSDNIRKKILGL